VWIMGRDSDLTEQRKVMSPLDCSEETTVRQNRREKPFHHTKKAEDMN